MTLEIPGPALFYCRTPLQSLIVNSLVGRVSGESVVLYHPTTSSEKHGRYFASIDCGERHFLPFRAPLFSDTLSDLADSLRLPREVARRRFASLCVSSVGSIPFGFLARRNPNAEIFTFDDGTFNLSEATYTSWIHDEARVRRIVKSFCRVPSNPAVLDRAVAHFTIFPPEFVVGDHRSIERVAILGGLSESSGARGRRVRVLLGSWFHDVALQARHDEIVEAGRADVFLPHPADARAATCSPWVGALLGARQLSHLVAEDVVRILREGGLVPVVYGFESTALYNLAGHVTAVSIHLEGRPTVVPAEVARALGVRQVRCALR